MIIDCHTHLGFNNILSANVKQLVSSMKKSGIDKAMVFAGQLNDCSIEKLLEETKNYQNILYPVGSISIIKQKPQVWLIEKLFKERKIFGLKFYPGYESFYPNDNRLKPFYQLLIKYNKPAIFHSGDTYNLVPNAKLKFAHPLNIDDLAVELPDLKIIIAHMGNPWVIDTAEVCLKNKNVFTDCAGLVYGKFDRIGIKIFKRFLDDFETFSLRAKKLLFGTDWPISDQKDYVTKANSLLGKNKDNYFYKNAQEVFGI